MKVLWIDPGGKTGWATYWCREIDGPYGKEYVEQQWLTGELAEPGHYSKLKTLIQLHHSETDYVIGYEKWHNQKDDEGYSRDKVDYQACEYIGVIKLTFEEQSDISGVRLVGQMPSQRRWADQRKMDVFDLWRLTRGQKDARSAAQHLLTYLGATLKYPPIMEELQKALNT